MNEPQKRKLAKAGEELHKSSFNEETKLVQIPIEQMVDIWKKTPESKTPKK